MIGRRLLHYEVTEKLGEGGMGIVYKGRDTHLDRFVALKVLPPDRVSSDERLRRFVQEAKAASALNHPNIITVHDVATDTGTTFMAMELVSGRTIEEVIPRQGLPIGRVLALAVQIADGLAAAHRAGIVHRDLKPGNVMVTDDGRVKILDFGLAKLGDAAFAMSEGPTRTATPGTGEGLIVGTVGYMSPEQAEGRPVDTRSDIFSFGVLLYEMVTGRKPFTRDTALKTLAAIVSEAPPPIADVAPGCPYDLQRLIDRCLRKDPDRRWQHVQDVRIALLEMKEESDSGTLAAPASGVVAATRARSRWPYVAGAAVLVAAAGGGWFLLRPAAPKAAAPVLQPVPLTSYEGDERDPAFSPDGNQIAFSWGPEGGVTNTYIKLVGPGDPIRLTHSPYSERENQWSPDGKWIAFDSRRDNGGVIIVVPALGGPERVVSTTTWRATWTPDSRFLVVPDGGSLYLAPLDGSERHVLMGPFDDHGVHPVPQAGAISPDGRTLVVAASAGTGLPLYFVPLGDHYQTAGPPRRATPADWNLSSWSWTPDNAGVIAIRAIGNPNQGGASAMYRIAVAGGEPQRLDFAGDNPWFLDVARSGHRLAYTQLRRDVNIYRAELGTDGRLHGDGTLVAASSRRESQAVWSPDGSRIAFSSNRSGSNEIWVVDRDGSNLVQLTTSANPDGTGSPAWSPDGTNLAYMARPAGALATDIYTVPAAGGAARRLTDDPAPDTAPFWSHDGASIYFTSNRGGPWALWKVAATGGPAVRVGSYAPAIGESPDGHWLYLLTNVRGTLELGVLADFARVPSSDTDQPPKILAEDRVVQGAVTVTSRGLYYLSPSESLKSATLRRLALDGGAPVTIGTIPKTVSAGLSISSDGRSILYSTCDQCAADIMLVENFR